MTQTPKLPEKLQVIKDQVVYEHDRYAAIGFDTCWSQLAPVIEEMRVALEHYESAHYDNEGYTCNRDKTAREALAKAREVLGE